MSKVGKLWEVYNALGDASTSLYSVGLEAMSDRVHALKLEVQEIITVRSEK